MSKNTRLNPEYKWKFERKEREGSKEKQKRIQNRSKKTLEALENRNKNNRETKNHIANKLDISLLEFRKMFKIIYKNVVSNYSINENVEKYIQAILRPGNNKNWLDFIKFGEFENNKIRGQAQISKNISNVYLKINKGLTKRKNIWTVLLHELEHLIYFLVRCFKKGIEKTNREKNTGEFEFQTEMLARMGAANFNMISNYLEEKYNIKIGQYNRDEVFGNFQHSNKENYYNMGVEYGGRFIAIRNNVYNMCMNSLGANSSKAKNVKLSKGGNIIFQEYADQLNKMLSEIELSKNGYEGFVPPEIKIIYRKQRKILKSSNSSLLDLIEILESIKEDIEQKNIDKLSEVDVYLYEFVQNMFEVFSDVKNDNI